MKNILFLLLIISSVSFADEFVPDLGVGDNWMVRREINAIDNLENNNNTIQYWKYEVINKIEFNNEEYLVIFANSKEVTGNIKLVVTIKKFILKEITVTDKNKSTVVDMEEVIAPVIDINILAKLYDLPAFPIIDPNLAKEYTDILPNGKKRIKKSFRRHYLSRGEVGSSELIWQETDNISSEAIKKYSKKPEDYLNKITNDGYLLQIKGETRKIRQIWVETVPWWVYNESVNERDYLVDFKSGSSRF